MIATLDNNSLLMLRCSEIFVAVGSSITAAELLTLDVALRDDGLLSWRVQSLTHPRITRLLATLGIDRCFRYPEVLGLIGTRLLAALLLIAAICCHWSVRPELFVLTLVTLLFTLRSPQGNDGADRMGLIILVTGSLADVIHTPVAYSTALLFIAAQGALSYGTSGGLKVRQTGWTNGDFVTDVLATSSFGNRDLLRLFQAHLFLRKWCGRFVAYGDCLLALAPLLPPLACSMVLIFGVALHTGIARILGLNTFLWAFVATYPAMIFVSTWLYSRF
jgi:hypothetical protein